MEADVIVQPLLVATWRIEHPILVRRVCQMWNEYSAIQIADYESTLGAS